MEQRLSKDIKRLFDEYHLSQQGYKELFDKERYQEVKSKWKALSSFANASNTLSAPTFERDAL